MAESADGVRNDAGLPAIGQRINEAAQSARTSANDSWNGLTYDASTSANARIKEALPLALRVIQWLHSALSGTGKRGTTVGLRHHRINDASPLERSTSTDRLHGLAGDIARNTRLGCHQRGVSGVRIGLRLPQ